MSHDIILKSKHVYYIKEKKKKERRKYMYILTGIWQAHMLNTMYSFYLNVLFTMK